MFAGLVLLFALVFDGRGGTGGIGDEDICPNPGLKPVASTRIVRDIQKSNNSTAYSVEEVRKLVRQ